MTVRILQVGMGVRGEQWSQVIRSHPGAVNIGYMRPELEIAKSQVVAWGEPDVPCFDNLEQAIVTLKPDMVLLATPPEGHLEQCRLAFKHGCHVLCEKPLTEEYNEAIEIVRMAEESGLLLGVGMNFRYLNVSQVFRKMITSGAMGEPSFGQYVYLRNRDGRRRDLNKYPLVMKQPMLLEQSVHHFDLMRYCYNDEIVAVRCDTWRPSWSSYEHHPCVSALFEFSSGLRANYLGTWTTGWNIPDFTWRTDCSKGALVQKELFSDLYRSYFIPELAIDMERGSRLNAEIARYEPLVELSVEPCVAFIDDSFNLLTHFVKAVEQQEALETSGVDHLKTLGVTLACVESSETGQRIVMEEFYRRNRVPEKWTLV